MTVEIDLPLDSRFTTFQTPSLLAGELLFRAPAGHGEAVVTIEGVGRGTVSWEGLEIGEAVECEDFTLDYEFGWISGTVRGRDGEPPLRAAVMGCGAYNYTEDDGSFYLQAGPGLCELHAEVGNNMARARGPTVAVWVEPGKETYGVDLIAPERPPWANPTAEEALKSRASLCRSWMDNALFWEAFYQVAVEKPGLTSVQRELYRRELERARAKLVDYDEAYCR